MADVESPPASPLVLSGPTGKGPARVRAALRSALLTVMRRRAVLGRFAAPFALYTAVGALLTFRYQSFNGDAQARLANAYYVLFSRDPHLGAIGFVWNPLPSLSVMPLLLLKGLWPALATRAFAGEITSAFFMAGCVVLVHSTLRDLNVRRGARILLTVGFALQPMVVYYGANGMSEAPFLYFLLAASRRLSRWLSGGDVWNLVLAGTALAFAYLARNEAVLPTALAAGLVAAATLLRADGPIRSRARAAALRAFIVAAPAAFAFLVWAVISWVVVGHPFEQFSSQYGNSAQVSVAGDLLTAALGGRSRPEYVGVQILGLAPALPLALLMSAWAVLRRRDARMTAQLTVLGGVLLFEVTAYLAGQTFGWLRFSLTAIPLCFLLVGCGLARPAVQVRPRRWVRAGAAVVLAGLVGGCSVLTSSAAMADRHLGREEYAHLGYIFDARHAHDPYYDERYRLPSALSVARYLDAKKLPAGSVVMDTFTPCAPFIDVASRRPRQFVITNDRDFKSVLADPVTFGARYLLVPPHSGYGSLDGVNRAYPSLYATGAGIAVREHDFAGRGCPALRLYRILRAGAVS